MTEASAFVTVAHVLFIDMVGYSTHGTSTQSKLVASLNTAVLQSPSYQAATSAGAVKALATGDGMALVFFTDIAAPARCAIEIEAALCDIPLRMGIHSGIVAPQVDINGNDNLVGEGLNTAMRVMGFGEAGHILLSKQYALWLMESDGWSEHVVFVGTGVAKHRQSIDVYHLIRPGSDPTRPPALSATPARPTNPKKAVLLCRRGAQPDEELIGAIESKLTDFGHEVIVNLSDQRGLDWAKDVESQIRGADAVIAIVSPKSLRSEILEFELSAAIDQWERTGRPAILPVWVGAREEVLRGPVASLVEPLPGFRFEGPDHRSLIAQLDSALRETPTTRPAEIRFEPAGGAVPPDSPMYVERSADRELRDAITNRESILLVRGPRQIGKTSLLGQGSLHAEQIGARQVTTDFQKLSARQMDDGELFCRLLAKTLCRQMEFEYDFERHWDPMFGANLNIDEFLRALLMESDRPLVWFLDEVDKLFPAPFSGDFFGLVRSWHNARTTESRGPWGRLTVVIGYATEAHLFIQDVNQSPFNVGRVIALDDFSLQQTLDLNTRYGGPLPTYQDAERLHALVGGHPYLVRRALEVVASSKWPLPRLFDEAMHDTGPFSDHLKRLLLSVGTLPHVTEHVKAMLVGKRAPESDADFRLMASGVIKYGPAGTHVFRCRLYEQFLIEQFRA
ncbi:MAG TPA: AAA-like domain-containing protein [Fimbriimonadaceae bacterium]|nr:AAA-like domain-containing protein [Fimbriimonadaceae bacterium]